MNVHNLPPGKEKGLGRMVFISALLHVFVVGGIVTGMAWQGPRVFAPISYTVELVDPAAVGGALSFGPLKTSVPPPPKEPEVKPSPPPKKQGESSKKVVEKKKLKKVKAKTVPKPSKAISPPKQAKKTPSSTPSTKKKETKQVRPKKIKLAKAKKVKTEPVPKVSKAVPPPKPTKKTPQPPSTPSAEELDKQYLAAIDRARQRAKRSTLSSPSRPNPAGVGRGGSGGGGMVRGAEFLVYYNQLQERVKESWIVTERKPGLSAVVRFGVQPNGKIFAIELVESSGDRAFDQSVLRAVNKANPLPPPPSAYQREFAVQKVEITFGAAEQSN